MSAMASQIISVSIACSAVCSGTDQRKHQSSASLAFVKGINYTIIFHIISDSWFMILSPSSLHWRHNDHGGVSNHQPHGCLLNRLFRRRSKKTSKLRVTGLCAGNSPGPVNSPHKGPVTRKMLPFDDVIMILGGSPGPSRTKLSRIAIGIELSLRTQTISLWHDLTKQRSSLWNVWITYVNIIELWGKWQLESVRIMGNGNTKCPSQHQNYLEVKIKIKHHRILRWHHIYQLLLSNYSPFYWTYKPPYLE